MTRETGHLWSGQLVIDHSTFMWHGISIAGHSHSCPGGRSTSSPKERPHARVNSKIAT